MPRKQRPIELSECYMCPYCNHVHVREQVSVFRTIKAIPCENCKKEFYLEHEVRFKTRRMQDLTEREREKLNKQ